MTVISSGGLLDFPWGTALDHAGRIIVVDRTMGAGDTGELVRVNPVDGSQAVVSSGGLFANPLDVAVDADGNLLVADVSSGGSGAIILVDPATGAQSLVASGLASGSHQSIAIDGAGYLYTTNLTPGGGLTVVRVDPATGVQTPLSEVVGCWGGGGITVDETASNIFVSEIYCFNGIISVDPGSGAQTTLAGGSPFQDPWDLDLDLDGNLVVADGNWWSPGKIIRVNTSTGASMVVPLAETIQDPSGIAVFKGADPPPADTDGDGVADNDDWAPLNPFACSDGDGDTCDDCISGVWDPLQDGLDTDSDGQCDAGDGCPFDPSKTEPGVCGCGVPDTDTDGDGLLYCHDSCPDEDATGLDADGNGCLDDITGMSEMIDTLVSENVIDTAMENSLNSKIENAEKSTSKDNICAAVNQLEALKSQVDAQAGKKISLEGAVLLNSYTDNIIAQLIEELPEGETCN